MPELPHDLGDGLTLRAATPADADALATFNALFPRQPSFVWPVL